jgi:hypothetical protein
MIVKEKKLFLGNIKNALFPPEWDASNDSCYTLDPYNYNCYAYALQLRIPLIAYEDINYQPGFLTNATPCNKVYDQQSLLTGFLSDCEFLGLKAEETETDSPLMKSAYKIMVCHYDPAIQDFHFVRQNKDGNWSHIESWGEKPTLVSAQSELRYFKKHGGTKTFNVYRK